jgi:23S rRNA (guanine745-N1)-methyltransferase
MIASTLTCPICKAPLKATDNRLGCEQNHSFDRAKQGYYNLLPANRMRSKQPGDSLEMVKARQTFLNTGIYQPISDTLNKLVHAQLNNACTELNKKTTPDFILDIGCGEGYYTERLSAFLKSQQSDEASQAAEIIGLDISKEAVKHAARRNKDITWIVASGAQVPVEQNSQTLITCLFTRLMPEGFADALTNDGQLITVTTGTHHLIEMRNELYDEVRLTTLDPAKPLGSHFEAVEMIPLTYQHQLQSSQEIKDLLAMTPHQWRAPEVNREKILSKQALTITIDIQLTVFRKKTQPELMTKEQKS